MANDPSKVHLIQLGLRLQDLRKSKNLSLRQLAANCNVEFSDISKYEKGEINMTLNTLVELAKGLDVELRDLIDFKILP